MKMKDSFMVKLAVELGFKALSLQFPGLAGVLNGCIGAIFKRIAENFLGYLGDKGILVIDLTKDSIDIALQRTEYREAALKAYVKAKAKIYTEEEKSEIRKQYLDIVRKYVPVGDAKPK